MLSLLKASWTPLLVPIHRRKFDELVQVSAVARLAHLGQYLPWCAVKHSILDVSEREVAVQDYKGGNQQAAKVVAKFLDSQPDHPARAARSSSASAPASSGQVCLPLCNIGTTLGCQASSL